jgi:hypothetical protein
LLFLATPLGLLAQPSTPPRATVPDQVLVRFNKPTTLGQARRELNNALLNVSEALVPSLDIFLVKLPKASIKAADAVAMLKSYPSVRWAQLDYYLDLRSTTPDDPQFGSQWSLSQPNDADIDAPEAWDITTGGTDPAGNDIVVAVVDNGCQLTHLDLAPNIWVNTGEIPGNGIDDDGNGYVDDVNGWNAYNINGTIPSPNAPYHGTHVSGIIGAVGNNGRQVCGINWHVKLMEIAASSTSTSVVSRGYNYALTQKTRWLASGGSTGANVVATNSSFGQDFGNCQSDSFPIWNDLYNAMGAAGILSACATANLNINVDLYGDVPTGCASPYMFSVTNTNTLDQKYSAAGYGRTTIDIGAPGTAILSTINTGTGTLSGTSMSSPHIAGAVAFLHAAASPGFYRYYMAHPDSAALLIKKFLMDSVDVLASMDTMTVSRGRVNLYRAATGIHAYTGPQPVQPFLIYINQSVEDSVTGNGNGALESGETARLAITLCNYGANATNVAATLSTADPYLTVVDSLGSFGAIVTSASQNNVADPFVVLADSMAPVGHIAQITLTLSAAGGYSVVEYFNLEIGRTVVYWADSVENGENGWTHGAVQPNYSDAWHISNEMSASPSNSWKCGGEGPVPYVNSLDAGLVSPPIAITSHSTLYFSQWMDAELSSIYPDSALDGGVVEISANGGPFDAVTPVGGYPKTFRQTRSLSYVGPMPGRPCFSGIINWVQRQVDLSAYAGQTIHVRFRFGSDSSGAAHEGWFVDDIFVRGVAPEPPPHVDPLTDVAIFPVGDDLQLLWSPPPSGANLYVIYRNNFFDFMPSESDSIGWTADTSYVDTSAVLMHPQAYYVIKAVKP